MGELLNQTETRQTIAAFVSGSQQAFAALYDQYAPALLGVLVRMINNTSLAEDTLQQSFITAWKNRSMCGVNKSGFFSWLLGIARNILAEKNVEKEKVSITNHEAFKEVYNTRASASFL